jgi:hypothetical protein
MLLIRSSVQLIVTKEKMSRTRETAGVRQLPVEKDCGTASTTTRRHSESGSLVICPDISRNEEFELPHKIRVTLNKVLQKVHQSKQPVYASRDHSFAGQDSCT